jgi:hypothetical protein
MAVVYTHTRLDTSQVFYVGIGLEEKRAYQKKFRNSHWKNIAKKHGYSVSILHKDISWEDACEIEKSLISKYKRKCDGGSLCNITIGGDGVVGVAWTEDHKRKISEGNKGKTRTEEQRMNISRGRTGIVFSQEHRKNISAGKVGKKLPLETCLKMSNSRKKPVLDLETGIFYDWLDEACYHTSQKIKKHKWKFYKDLPGKRFVYV